MVRRTGGQQAGGFAAWQTTKNDGLPHGTDVLEQFGF